MPQGVEVQVLSIAPDSVRVTIRSVWEARAASAAAPDAIVLFDVFRASTTLLALFSCGPGEVVATNDRRRAEALRAEGYLLISEVFAGDFDNSPSQVLAAPLAGKKIVHKSTNLTTVLFALELQAGQRAYLGGFGNLSRLTSHLVQAEYQHIELVPAGHFAKKREADEDSAAAELLAAYLRGKVCRDLPRRTAIDAYLQRLKERREDIAEHYFRDAALALEIDRFPELVCAEPRADGLVSWRRA